MAFPAGLTPLLRFDATQIAYTDLAQAVPAAAPTGRVRSLPQPSPLSGSWTAPSDQERGTFAAAGSVVCEPLALDYPTHNGQYFNAPAPASAVSGNSCTLAISFRSFQLFSGPEMALLTTGAFGFFLGGNGVALRYNGGTLWDSLIRLGKDLNASLLSGDGGEGNLVCIVARYSPTGLDIYVDEEGNVSTASLTTTVNPSTPSAFLLGYSGNGFGQAVFAHADVIDGVVTDPQRLALIAYLKADSAAPAFPTTQPLISVIGDSIGVPFGVTSPSAWDYRMLANVQATYPDARLLNVSISGSGIATTSGDDSVQHTTVVGRLSTLRSKQVTILQQGTNSLASDPSNAGVDGFIAAQFALADAQRAAGAKVIIATIADRTGLLGGTTQLQFNAARARYNAGIVAGGPLHCDAVVRLDLIAGLGNNGDSTSLVNFIGDGVHFAPPGHALAEPAYTAAVLSVFASVPAALGRCQMQAKSSADGRLYSWISQAADWGGVGFFSAGFPGTPLDVVKYSG
jgi:hypothetical protein